MAREQDMKQTRKKPGAGSRPRWRWRRSRATGPSPSWRARTGFTRTRSTPGRKLLDGARSVFEGGSGAAEDTASAAQVDVLYRQIGQLKVENDFLSRKLGK